jgi:eukaryotic-like serine/threonine-protein kinase
LPSSKPIDDPALPLDVLQRIDAACIRFEDAWKNGLNPELAAYLAGADQSDRPALLRELLRVELHYRRRSGEDITPDDYVALLPDDEGAVRAAFSTVKLQALAAPIDTPSAAGAAPPSPVLWPTVPGYQILGQIGKGGMGVVYKAEQLGLKRQVALKMILHADHSSPEIRTRFRREAESLARMKHQNIVEVYEIGECNGTPFYSMEYVEGGSLNHYLDHKPLPPKFAARLLETLARTVHVAHQSGVIHRDLKPGNILLAFARKQGSPGQGSEAAVTDWLDASFVPKLTDFGLAKRADDSVQTQSGAVLGTPSYMAPEQVLGSNVGVSPATDVYALGAVLYELLCGRPPFKGATPGDAFLQLLKDSPQKPRKSNLRIPRELEAVCLKCLEKNPALRYATAEALADDLQRWLRGEPTLAQPPAWPSRMWRWSGKHRQLSAALVLMPLVALAAGGIVYFNDPERQLETIQTNLAKDQVVTLIGETGGPKWSAWANGKGGSQTSRADDGVFSVHSWTLGLLELVHRPPKSYMLHAEVKHDKSGFVSDVGLFFALKEYPTPRGPLLFFCQVTFNDIRDTATPPPNLQGKVGPSVQKGNPVHIMPYLMLKADVDSPLTQPGAGLYRRLFNPAGPDGGSWRKLLVKVAPEGVDVFWEGQHVGFLSASEINQATQESMARIQASSNAIPGTAIQPVFDMSGSLGLFVSKGSASYRRVVIESRPEN